MSFLCGTNNAPNILKLKEIYSSILLVSLPGIHSQFYTMERGDTKLK